MSNKQKMREALKRLADACDVVVVTYFDTDTMSDEVPIMQAATRDARAALAEQPAQGEAAALRALNVQRDIGRNAWMVNGVLTDDVFRAIAKEMNAAADEIERLYSGLKIIATWAAGGRHEEDFNAIEDKAMSLLQPAQCDDWSSGQVDADGVPLVTITKTEYERLTKPAQVGKCKCDPMWCYRQRVAPPAPSEQPAQGEAVKPDGYVVLQRDGSFARAENYASISLTRKVSPDVVFAADMNWPENAPHKQHAFWFAPPAPAVPDGWKLVPTRSTPEWIETLTERGLKVGSLAGLIEGVLAAAPEVPRG